MHFGGGGESGNPRAEMLSSHERNEKQWRSLASLAAGYLSARRDPITVHFLTVGTN